jgi:hypothetical protein
MCSVVVEVLVILDRLPHDSLLEKEKRVAGSSRGAREARKPLRYVMSDNHKIHRGAL